MKNEVPEKYPPLIQNLTKDGILLPTQVATIYNLYRNSKYSVEYFLLSLDLISENTLQLYLQELSGFESLVNPFIKPSTQATSLIDGDFALEHKVIPQEIDGNSCNVLILPETDNSSLELLREKTGKYCIPEVVCLIRFKYLLHLFYDHEIDDRILKLAQDKIFFTPPQEKPESATNFIPELEMFDPYTGPVNDPKMAKSELISKLPLLNFTYSIINNADREIIPVKTEGMSDFADTQNYDDHETGFSSLKSHSLDSYQDIELDEISSILSMVQTRNDLPEVFYRFGSRSMRTCSLLTCIDDYLMGWEGTGLGLLPQRIEGIILPQLGDHFINTILEENTFFGKPSSNPVNKRLMMLFGGDLADFILGTTVSIKNRPVIIAIFIVDDESNIENEVFRLQQIAKNMSSCIIRLIKKHKSN
ncbi:MAG: hypothetical protein ACQES9_04955 [Myxococcota bacterium]